MTNYSVGRSRLGVMMAVAAGIIVVFGLLGFFGIQTFLDSRQSTVVSADDGPGQSPSVADDTESGSAAAADGAPSSQADPGAERTSDARSDMEPDSDSVTGGDEHYSNRRYGYSIDLPEGWSVSEADDGDGLTMTSPKHSGEILVYGTNVWPVECDDAGATTVSECADARAAALKAEGFGITYQQTKGDWFVVSGSDSQGQGTYERWYLGPGSVNALVVNFPMSERDSFDEITSDLSKSLTPGDLSVSH